MVTGKTVAVGKVVDVPPAGSPTFWVYANFEQDGKQWLKLITFDCLFWDLHMDKLTFLDRITMKRAISWDTFLGEPKF